MKFSKYQHVERLGTPEVEGILDGTVCVFPKLDGANASVWLDGDELCCASRTRKLGNTDQGGWGKFIDYIHHHEGIISFLKAHPDMRLYGEWLIPHTLRTYVPEAWNQFHVFDITRYPDAECLSYIPYPIYKPWMEQFGIGHIPCLAVVENGVPDVFTALLDKNTYLIQPDKGIGEGVVLKRYDFVNKFGRTTWAKVVANAFKFGTAKSLSAPTLKGGAVIEEVIVNEFVTADMVNKEFAQLAETSGGWEQKYIPALLGCVFHALVTEEMWHILKKFKSHQVIDFRVLEKFTIAKVKQLKSEVF